MMDALGAREKLKGTFYVKAQSCVAGIGARIESWKVPSAVVTSSVVIIESI